MNDEEIFNNMMSWIENNSDGSIKNIDGRVGTLVIENGEVYILCDNDKIYYNIDAPLSTIIDDGWLLE